MAQDPRSDPRQRPAPAVAAMRRPSVLGSFLLLVPAVLLGSSNLPALVALVVICAIWIWYEAKG